MKTLVIILSIYFLVLSVFPCADVCVALGLMKEGQTQSAQSSTDNCPLFCVCNCCGSVITLSGQTLNLGLPLTHPTFFITYSEHPLSEYFHPIWQPPKQV